MTRTARRLAALGAALLAAACGSTSDLEPVAPATLPAAPYGSSERPTAEQLLEPSPMAVPERSVELRRESEEREDDPFDLPPE